MNGWDDEMLRDGLVPCRGCMDAPAESRYGWQCRRCWWETGLDEFDADEAERAEADRGA